MAIGVDTKGHVGEADSLASYPNGHDCAALVSVKTPSPDWNVFNLVSTANGEVRLSPREVLSWRTETIHATTSKEPTMDAITTLVEGAIGAFLTVRLSGCTREGPPLGVEV